MARIFTVIRSALIWEASSLLGKTANGRGISRYLHTASAITVTTDHRAPEWLIENQWNVEFTRSFYRIEILTFHQGA